MIHRISTSLAHPGTESNEPFPNADGAASGPFCCRSFSSNFANSFTAISSSGSVIWCTPLTSSICIHS